MTDLLIMLRQALRHFGRPGAEYRVSDLRQVDERLTTLEQRQREIAARLRLLELQGDSRGVTHDGG